MTLETILPSTPTQEVPTGTPDPKRSHGTRERSLCFFRHGGVVGTWYRDMRKRRGSLKHECGPVVHPYLHPHFLGVPVFTSQRSTSVDFGGGTIPRNEDQTIPGRGVVLPHSLKFSTGTEATRGRGPF